MKYLNAEAFKKSDKKNQTLLIVGLLLLIITIILVYFGIKNSSKPLPEPENLGSLIENKNYTEDKYSYLDVAIKPYLFAVYETDGKEEDAKYYLAMDKENHLYILYMKDDKYKELNIDGIEVNPIRVYGITKKIPYDIKDLAISSYNELMKNEYLTNDNFKDYVGLIYLDTKSEVNDSSIYYLGAFLTGFFFVIMIITYIVIIIKNKKTLKNITNEEIAKIDSEISQMSSSEYNDMKFYLLKDYLVDLSNNIVILKYSDIIWAYPFEQRYNGLLVNKCIKIVDRNNKVYNVSNTKVLNKNKDEIIEDILRKLKEKNADIILGFTSDNRKLVKQIIKDLKNK